MKIKENNKLRSYNVFDLDSEIIVSQLDQDISNRISNITPIPLLAYAKQFIFVRHYSDGAISLIHSFFDGYQWVSKPINTKNGGSPISCLKIFSP